MISIFRIQSEPWIKIGYTQHDNPWIRAQKGFWTNSHPRALCNKLSDLTLVAAYIGDTTLEKQIQKNYPPDHCEFWKLDRLPDIICYLNQATSEIRDTWQPIKDTPDEQNAMLWWQVECLLQMPPPIREISFLFMANG